MIFSDELCNFKSAYLPEGKHLVWLPVCYPLGKRSTRAKALEPSYAVTSQLLSCIFLYTSVIYWDSVLLIVSIMFFVLTAASLSLKSFHAQPFQDELNAFLSKVSWAYGSFSDCLAALNTYDVR